MLSNFFVFGSNLLQFGFISFLLDIEADNLNHLPNLKQNKNGHAHHTNPYNAQQHPGSNLTHGSLIQSCQDIAQLALVFQTFHFGDAFFVPALDCLDVEATSFHGISDAVPLGNDSIVDINLRGHEQDAHEDDNSCKQCGGIVRGFQRILLVEFFHSYVFLS